MAANVAVSVCGPTLTVTGRDAVVTPSDQLAKVKSAFGVARAVAVRPQSPTSAPAESATVPPLVGVVASVSVHCCTNAGVMVTVVAFTTTVSGFVVDPPLHAPNRYPVAAVAVTVTLRPQVPVAAPVVSAAAPPVAVLMAIVH